MKTAGTLQVSPIQAAEKTLGWIVGRFLSVQVKISLKEL